MQNQSLDIPLHDIKPLVEVSDNSLILFIVLVLVGAVLILGLAYLLFMFLKRRKKESRRKDAFAALQGVDFKDAKASAYAITAHGFIFADDSHRTKAAYEKLLNHLAPYKYKKEVNAIDEECRSYYEIYVGMIDV
ncbi:MAG: hypothetical protein U9P71_07895 [Campylobacterota bacterium]|nr:hypothetical protein [Campylobacterota bacterium]